MSLRTKQEIRQHIIRLLHSQKEEDRLKKSRMIQDRLFAGPEFAAAKTVFFYVAFDGEVETMGMIKEAQQQGKTIALPKIEIKNPSMTPVYVDNVEKDLDKGPYGIWQPRARKGAEARPQDLDLCVVPGIAFDRHNQRVGRGGGYYDRFLSNGYPRLSTIGLAFDFQLLDHLPIEPHDQPVGRVLSNASRAD